MYILPSRKLCTALLVVIAVLASGCSINHPVAKDYQAHIDNDKYPHALPKSNLQSSYAIDEQTINHRYEFRSATVGYAHLWIVEFGKILDLTLNADYVQQAFGRLDKVTDSSIGGNILTFTLESYTFENYQANVTMLITLEKDGLPVFTKSYSGSGVNQAGKMWAGGPFAMKNATLQSTKFAIDDILVALTNDLNLL
jgi:hypothetical protein